MMIVLKCLSGTEIQIPGCHDCPFYADPDPYPTFCRITPHAFTAIDVAYADKAIPKGCPLVGLQIESRVGGEE